RVTESPAAIVALGSPLVIEHDPPLSIASVTPVSVTASQSFGFFTVIVPLTCQSLSVPESCETSTVYFALAVPALGIWNCVLSPLFAMLQANVRVKVGGAVLLPSRSAPWQSVTVWPAEPVAPVSFVVNVAQLSWVLQVPAGSATVCE